MHINTDLCRFVQINTAFSRCEQILADLCRLMQIGADFEQDLADLLGTGQIQAYLCRIQQICVDLSRFMHTCTNLMQI